MSTLLFGEVVEVSLNGTKYGMHFQIMSANAIDANAGAKLLKNMDFQRFMGFMKRKNMIINAILPLKWQNTADIVAILVGLKQETVSLLPRKCARGICGTMIA